MPETMPPRPGGSRRSKNCCGEGELIAVAGAPGAEAAPDDGIERLAATRRRSVETSDIGPIAGLREMLGDQAEVAGLVEQAPAGDRLGRETSVREGHDERRARLQHARDLEGHFARPRDIMARAEQCSAMYFGIAITQPQGPAVTLDR